MSGYASKTEAMDVLRQTIVSDHNRTGLPTDPRRYNLAAIFREVFYHRGAGYGWGLTGDAGTFVVSLRRHLRAS